MGAHLSVAGGLARCLPRAVEVGAEVAQVFVANPRAWKVTAADAAADEQFAGSCVDGGLPVFVHAPYLVNVGSPPPSRSGTVRRDALAFSLRRGAAIGARGVVVHAGSAVGQDRDAALARLRPTVLDRARLPVRCARAPPLADRTDGRRWCGAWRPTPSRSPPTWMPSERDERIGVCLDTCHMHAAGHDLSTPAAMRRAVREYGRAAGPGGIALVHVNDSRDPVGSRRDRHASIGSGTIGTEPFRSLFTAPALRGVAVRRGDRRHRRRPTSPRCKRCDDGQRACGAAPLDSLPAW